MLPNQNSITCSTVQDVASFLHKSVATIYTLRSRSPESLPPVLPVPGSSTLLFVNVHEWAAGLMLAANQPIPKFPVTTPEVATATALNLTAPTPPLKRGRPSHASRKAAAEKENKKGA